MIREVEALGGEIVGNLPNLLLARSLPLSGAVLLTYVHKIRNGKPTDVETLQARRESQKRSHQETRYGPHGLHEFKGKFNPQTPRSLILQERGRWKRGLPILDPFTGSGTTQVEARHLGYPSIGVELNPLSALIARAKLLWETRPSVERISIETIRSSDFTSFSPESERYLRDWFPLHTLRDVRRILGSIQSLPKREQLVGSAILSNLLRAFSFQDPKDLRIRRREVIPQHGTIISAFVEEFNRELVRRKRWADTVVVDVRVPAIVLQGSSTCLPRTKHTELVAGTVCSPPYATALPYVDTYRLSHVVLGLTEPRGLSSIERSILGARDISRTDIELFATRIDALPKYARSMLTRLRATVGRDSKAGFRKRAVPYALARYLCDMAGVLQHLRSIENRGARNLWVVGPNRTRVNGREIQIPTPRLLGDLALHEGFQNIKYESLDAFGRYDIHSKNSIRFETLVSFDG